MYGASVEKKRKARRYSVENKRLRRMVGFCEFSAVVPNPERTKSYVTVRDVPEIRKSVLLYAVYK